MSGAIRKNSKIDSSADENAFGCPRITQELISFIEQAPVAIALFDRDMRYLAASRHWNAGCGRSGASLTGLSHYEVFPQTPARWRDVHKRVLAGEEVACDEDPVPRTDGRADCVRWTMKPWRYPNGEVRGALAFKEVITTQVEARAKIARSEALFRETFENAPVGIAHVAHDGRWLLVNPRLCKMTGYSAAEFLTKTVRDLTHPDDFEAHLPEIKSMYRAEIDNFDMEKRYIHKDGSIVWVTLRVSCARKDSGAIDHYIAVIVDVSQQKMAELALRESEEQFRTLADAIPQLAWIANAGGWTYWYNRRWYEYTGTTPKQMEGWGWQSVHDPETLPEVVERWKGSIATGEPFDMVFPLRGADGVFRPFLTRVLPLKNMEGRVVRWFGTNTDVDELKRAEEALRESEERERAKRHELETILSAIPAAVFIAEDAACTQISANPTGRGILRIPDGANASKSAPEPEAPANFETFSADGKPLKPEELPMQLAAASGRAIVASEVELRFTDGDRKFVIGNALPLFGPLGEVRGAVGVFFDITDRKRAEERVHLLMREVNHRSKRRC